MLKDIIIGVVVIVAVYVVVKMMDAGKEIGKMLQRSNERQEGEN